MSWDQIKNNFDKSLPSIQKSILNVLATEGEKSIHKNFEVGGRPTPWKKSKKPKRLRTGSEKTLVVWGNLSNILVQPNPDASGVKFLTNPLARAYARIHQEGGTINHPGGRRKLKKVKPGDKTKRTVFAKAGAKRFVKEVDIKPYKITIPPRPYLVIPPEDYPGILKAVQQIVKL